MVKVVIIGAPRTGTTLLQGFCNEHPDIKPVAGEIFSHDLFLWQTPVSQDLRDIVRETCRIEKFTWDNMAKERLRLLDLMSAVLRKYNGFKVIYDQLLRTSRVWRALRTKNFKIVHMRRKNLLDRAVSQILAAKSGVWHVRANRKPPKERPVLVNPHALDKILGSLASDDAWFAKYFSTDSCPNVLDVNYEEVFEWKTLRAKVEDFLGVKRSEIPPPYRKRTTEPPSKTIKNYPALKKFFDGTVWEKHFR